MEKARTVIACFVVTPYDFLLCFPPLARVINTKSHSFR